MKLKHILLTLCLALLLLAAPAAAAGGAGTAASPYIIQTPAELQSMANDLSAYYVLGNNLDMGGYTYTPVGTTAAPFFGSLDGRGYTISNLNINLPSTQYVGLFGVITAGTTIKNLKFADCTISGAANTGTLYGRCIGISGVSTPFDIDNIDVERCTVTSSSSYVGGIAGAHASAAVGTLSNCNVVSCAVSSTSSFAVGGIAGYLAISQAQGYAIGNTVRDCVIESTSSSAVGGIAGCLATSQSQGYANENIVENCVITGSYYVGGIAGSLAFSQSQGYANENIVENCSVKARNSYAGGIAGCKYASGFGSISGCAVSNTTVQANSYAGGICSTFTRT